MARRPDWSQHTPDRRFDPYRERVGHLYRGQEEAGLLLVHVDARATAVSGLLWWTKWSPTYDSAREWVLLDGQFSDHVVPRQGAEQALQTYAESRYLFRGETLRLEWADPAESAQLPKEFFGNDH